LILVDASLSNLTAGFDPGGFFSPVPEKIGSLVDAAGKQKMRGNRNFLP
jgi:hypothetical protein